MPLKSTELDRVFFIVMAVVAVLMMLLGWVSYDMRRNAQPDPATDIRQIYK
jgi:hypothetical protein